MGVHRSRSRQAGIALSLFCAAILLIRPQISEGQQRPPLPPSPPSVDDLAARLKTELISFTATITDKEGRAIAGLDKQAFTVFDNDVRQEISFYSNQDLPASVGIVFDVSGSINETKLRLARRALSHFIESSHKDDDYSLISFSERPRLLIEKTNDSDLVLNRVAGLTAGGRTALYDAIARGLEQLTRGAHPKRTLIVLSDGEDNNSRIRIDQLRKTIQESDAVVYAIGAGTDSAGKLTPSQMRGGYILERLAEASGGKAFFPQNSEEMIEIFEQIALELRRQYSIAYTPSNFVADGRWHRIKVRVAPPSGLGRLSVRHRPGYFAESSFFAAVR